VLDIREKEEQLKRAELIATTEKLSDARAQLFIQKRILENLIEEISGLTPDKRILEQEFLLKNTAKSDEIIKNLGKIVEELAIEQKKKIAELLQVRKTKEALEKLKEKARQEYIKEQEKLEQKELDESSTISFSRKKMSENAVNSQI